MVKPLACAAGLVVLVWPLGTPAQNYIGAERCKSCHEFAFKVWAAGPHAKAHLALDQEQIKDPKCNTCHTMLPGDDTTRFVGVQCERCHGPGRYYHHDYVMKDKELARLVGLIDPKPEQCQQCHTDAAPSIALFDFATLWKRIDHGKAAQQAWEKDRAATATSPAKSAPAP
ncbi:MAG: hypothetical protein HYZ27_02860 [Deltaproteobacteria bacterium]|nr:hypothetical protein [Deltaproteobacteria bacterium]